MDSVPYEVGGSRWRVAFKPGAEGVRVSADAWDEAHTVNTVLRGTRGSLWVGLERGTVEALLHDARKLVSEARNTGRAIEVGFRPLGDGVAVTITLVSDGIREKLVSDHPLDWSALQAVVRASGNVKQAKSGRIARPARTRGDSAPVVNNSFAVFVGGYSQGSGAADTEEGQSEAGRRPAGVSSQARRKGLRALPHSEVDLPEVWCGDSPLRWRGAKKLTAKRIALLYAAHRHRRFVDLFCGGLSVSLTVLPGRVLACDRCPGVIEFWQAVQRGLVISSPPIVDSETFLAARERYNALKGMPDVLMQRASEFYTLNRTCSNGAFRLNREERFTGSYQARKTRRFAKDMLALKPVVAGWEFVCGNALEVELDPEDFVYADPPFDGQTDITSPVRMQWADHGALAAKLAVHPGPVIVSSSATSRMVDLYQGLGYEVTRLNPGPEMGPLPTDREVPKRHEPPETIACRNLWGLDGRPARL